MKFIYHLSIATLFGYVVVAAPANSLSLSLSLKDGDVMNYEDPRSAQSPAFAVQPNIDVVTKEYARQKDHEVCLLPCYYKELPCYPEDGWVAKEQDGCWACCKDFPDEDSAEASCAGKARLLAGHKGGKPGL